jgi:hypothetical protein
MFSLRPTLPAAALGLGFCLAISACVPPSDPATVQLTLAPGANGTLSVTPAGQACAGCAAGTTQYAFNTAVTVTATPNAGFGFAGFSGACVGTLPCRVVLNASEQVSATFAPLQAALTVALSGAGSGTVTSAPAGINCGSQCSATFNQGTMVTLTAVPDAASDFVGWSGACEGSAACTVEINAALVVSAKFAPKSRTLSVTTTGPGVITSTPNGLYCGDACTGSFAQGSSVMLVASAEPGAVFAGWGGACSGTGICVVALDSDKTVTAAFTYNLYSVNVTRTGSGSGKVESIPAGIDCGTNCSASFQSGAMVVLTAAPDAMSVFSGWSGDCTGSGVCVVPVNGAHAVTAAFDPLDFSLTVATFGAGSVASADGAINCGSMCLGSYPVGAMVTLTATPVTGNVFNGWSGACFGTGPCQLAISRAQTVVAGFSAASVTGLHTMLTNGPSDPTRSTSATFWFTGSPAAASFVCSLDGARPTACASPATYSGLTNALHTFTAAAVDASGNVDPAPATYQWTVDTLPPVTTLTAMPANPSNVTSPGFSFTSSKANSTFACRLDANAPARCTSPFALSSVAPGQHLFVVTATDRAGNTDPTPATYGWLIDTTPPHTSIVSGPPNPSNVTSPVFSFQSNKEGSTFSCSLDGGVAVACVSPLQVGPLMDGNHSLQVVATDTAGNVDPTPATARWTVDTVLPVISTLSATPLYAMAGSTVTITFLASKPLSGSPSVTVAGLPASEPSLGAGTYTSMYTVTGNEPQGSATVAVSVTDLAGNVGTASTGITLDFTPPTIAVSVSPPQAKQGTTVTITAVASEPLQGTPSATIAGRTLTMPTVNGQTYIFTTTVQPGDAETSQPVTVTGTDLAGNQGGGTNSVVFDFHVDFVRASMTLLRTPVGSPKAVSAVAGATESGASVAVFQDAALTLPLGTATAADDGSFSATLSSADLPTVYIVITDLAGNVSAATQPGQVQATLNFAGVAQGSASHTAYVRHRVNELAPPNAAAESGSDGVPFVAADDNAMAAVDSVSTGVSEASRPLGWRGVKPAQASSMAMAWDPVAQRAVALISTFPEKATWTWNGTAWSFASVQGSPDWNGFSMAWDGVNSRVMLWAGSSCCGGALNTNYYFDGTQFQALAPNNTPSARNGASMTWDAGRQVIVMYGGGSKAETWEWNGTDWNNKTPGANNPPGLNQAPLAYDGTHLYTLLLAGSTTYTWSGTAWTRLAVIGPPSNPGDTMAWDAHRNVVVFHGANGQTWEWNGVVWNKIAAINEPGSLYGAVLVYDTAHQTTFLHGGAGHAESYTWDGTTWTRVNGPSPSARSFGAMTYDSVRGKTVMYGGQYAPSDTWEWNGTDWNQAQATNATIGGRGWLGLAAGGGTVLLQGGYNQGNGYFSDTYTWNGTAWTTITGASPGQHAYQGMAWDPVRSNFVLYGGTNSATQLTDTWLFSGTAWAKQNVSGPAQRTGPAMMAFPPRKTVVLQGGSGNKDTWEWNGAAWAQVQPLISGATGPIVSFGHGIVYDNTRNRLVLLDPSAGSYTWEWDGGTWRQATIYPAPGRTDGCSMAWHDAATQAVLFCGAGSYSSGYPTGDTWVYAPPRYGGQVFTLNVGSTTVPTAVSVKAVVGGTGDAGGGALKHGGRLLVWNATQQLWADAGSNTAADTDPQGARTIAPAPLANPAQYAVGGQLTLMVLPAVPTGAVAGEIATDYVEATVTYPLP